MALLDDKQYAGLLNFLQSPQTMALAGGLLQGAAPSMTQPSNFASAFGKGLQEYNKSDIALRKIKSDKQNLTGLPQEYASLETLKSQVGENHPTYLAAKRALDLRLASQESMINYREKLYDTADKRYSTSMGKHGLEIQDIEEGFVPGTDRTVRIQSENEKNKLLNSYKLKIQKDTTDPKTRERVLFAKNIDKTIKSIDIDKLVKYAGAFGTIDKLSEQAKSFVGRESEEYRQYNENLVAVKLLAKQMRQFYGDSISPSVNEDLKTIANPSTWYNSPNVAKRTFERLVSILNQEEDTFREALTSISAYEKEAEASPMTTEDPLGWRSK